MVGGKNVIYLIFIIFLTEVASLPAWLTPQTLDKVLETVSPFFTSPQEPRAAENLKSIREVITKSAQKDEGWTDLTKRVALAVAGKKETSLDEEISNPEVVQTLYEASPQSVKDLVSIQKKGLLQTFLDRFEELKKQTSENNKDDKQIGGGAFFVPGVNLGLNLLYTGMWGKLCKFS